MTASSAQQEDDFSAAFQKAYRPSILTARLAGRTGSTIIHSAHEDFDWRAPLTPDLLILLPKTVGLQVHADLGAGRFASLTPAHCVAVKAPNAENIVIAHDPHEVMILSVPYSQLLILAGDGSDLPVDGDFGPLSSRFSSDADLTTRVLALNTEIREGSGRGALFADGALLQIVDSLLALRDGAAPTRSNQSGGLAPWQVKRVCEAMIAAMDVGEEELSLAELALTVGLSANHFCRSFAKSMGQPPHQWISARRIERSKALMADATLSLTDVAQLVGYTSQSAFGRAFQRAVGETPSGWRRAMAIKRD